MPHVMLLTPQLCVTAPAHAPGTGTACRIPKQGKLFMRCADSGGSGATVQLKVSQGQQQSAQAALLPGYRDAYLHSHSTGAVGKARMMHTWQNR